MSTLLFTFVNKFLIMKINQIIQIVSAKEQKQIKQVEFAKILGYSREYVSKLCKKNKELSIDKIELIEKHFDVNLTEPTPEEIEQAEKTANKLDMGFDLTKNEWESLGTALANNKNLIFLFIEKLEKNPQAAKRFLLED